MRSSTQGCHQMVPRQASIGSTNSSQDWSWSYKDSSSHQGHHHMFVDMMTQPEVAVEATQSATQKDAGQLSLGPMAQCVVHALKGLACRARATPACSPASHCKQC